MKPKAVIVIISSILLICSCIPDSLAETPTPIPTPLPTATQIPMRIVSEDFELYISTFEDHGAILNIQYSNDQTLLEEFEITANIFQDGEIKDKNLTLSSINNQLAFEIIDAKYYPGTITVEVIFEENGNNQSFNRDLNYEGNYSFIYPIFRENDYFDKKFSYGDYHIIREDSWFVEGIEVGSKWYAKDFCMSNQCENSVIHMPFSFVPIRFRAMTDICQPIVNFNLYIQNPYTGHICMMGHTQPGELIDSIVENSDINNYGNGFVQNNFLDGIIDYDPNRELALIGPQDGCSGYAHLHLECQSPYLPLELFGQNSLYFGYDNSKLRYGFCNDEGTPCEESRNIEMADYLISDWIMP